MKSCLAPLRTFLSCMLPAMVLGFAGAATAQAGAPAAAGLSHIEGSVVYAPAGATQWTDLPRNRAVRRGDRLWTDKGARAEVQLGSAALLHMDGETFVEVTALDQRVMHADLNEGTLNARVRLGEGADDFEIRTPQLAFRALQPGDWRLDADPVRGITRVTLRSGSAMVYGSASGALQLQAGQQISFTGRDLKVTGQAAPRDDRFDRWAADRNHARDQALSARQGPRAVTAQQSQPSPQGHWEWMAPWGWTWVQPQFPPQGGGYWQERGGRGWRRSHHFN